MAHKAQLLWCVQGGVAAVAIASVLEIAGFARKDEFRVVHAIGAQWMDWTRHLSAWLATRLPIMISQTIANSRHAEPTDRVMSYVGLVFVLYGMAIVLAPGNLDNTPGVFASAAAATCIGFILAVGMTGNHAAEHPAHQGPRPLPLVLLIAGKQLGWAASDHTFLVAVVCASLTAVVSLGAIMLNVARPYVVAFVATLAFFGIWEILTWIPAVEQQIGLYL